MTTAPLGSPTRAELKFDALQALDRSRLTRGSVVPARLDNYGHLLEALVEGVQALTYATLADGEPTIENKLVATFGEPAGAYGIPHTPPPMPLFTVQWNYDDGPSHPKLQLVGHDGDQDGFVGTWYTIDDDVDASGMIRDVAALASWVAGGIVEAVARSQGWDRGLKVATIVRAGEKLTGDS